MGVITTQLAGLARAVAEVDARRRALLRAGPEATGGLRQSLAEAERALAQAREGVEAGGTDPIVDAKVRPGDVMGAQTTGLEVKVWLRLAAVPTGAAHLLREPLLEIEVEHVKGKAQWARVRVRAEIVGYSAPAVASREIKQKDKATIALTPTLFRDAVRDLHDLTRASLHVTVDNLDTGSVELDETRPVDLLPRTSAYIDVLDPKTKQWLDLTPLMAAWVTPNDPAIMAFLREAAEVSPGQRLVGYQVDEAGVEAQVKAIFDALHARGIVYVHSVLASGNTAAQYFQRVRLPAESLATRSANCIDGTVLMASALEAASLEPGIVFVPGHALLAFRTRDSGAHPDAPWRFVETTKLQGGDFGRARESGEATASDYAAKAKADPKNAAATFNLVSVKQQRQEGVLPMG